MTIRTLKFINFSWRYLSTSVHGQVEKKNLYHSQSMSCQSRISYSNQLARVKHRSPISESHDEYEDIGTKVNRENTFGLLARLLRLVGKRYINSLNKRTQVLTDKRSDSLPTAPSVQNITLFSTHYLRRILGCNEGKYAWKASGSDAVKATPTLLTHNTYCPLFTVANPDKNQLKQGGGEDSCTAQRDSFN